MRTGHQLLGAVTAAGITEILAAPPATAVAVTVIAALAAPLPDIDQRKWWRESLGKHKAFKHRRLTHWWGIPAACSLVLLVVPPAAQWIVGAAIIGVFSHLLGDWVFGKRGPAATGWRGPGIPLAPWWGYHGVGLKCGGKAERFGAWPTLGAILIVQTAVLAGI